ncbi:CRISPR-associated Cas4 family exonuclease [Cereibacter ovatus]|uniref:CRISPR-associated exonuclease Cas4 n=1 Tax=Cereibacter ovatus TaxID=439529 RepID=A0A285D5I5_9RHOB|nr:CRISPR-associated protein Cas4 [Cereibacter ovatus]SNX75081.1 CRISPR-associated Cas4 family exonuclease [Cereibacter ovatus]
MPPLPADEEPIPLSAVQHAVYCLRQAALIHLERLWDENRFTAEGDVLHAVADKGGSRRGRGVRRVLSLPLGSVRLNLTGIADLVEFQPVSGGGERAFPVEYKRGKPKLHRADEVQLCAQALCLEEMTEQPVPEGALFYAQTRRRVIVPFDADLRALTEATVADLARLLGTRITPPPTPHRSRCRACSLLDLCRPDTVSRPVRCWRDQTLARLLEAP